MQKGFLTLVVIGVLAIALRFPFIDRFPAGFSGDEAIQGYTAWSILKTGRDEWGEFLPLFPRSFGDFKPPLYTYLTIPSVALFGLSEFAVRLPSAVVGTATVILLFFLSQKLFGNFLISALSSLFLAISPWHFQFSRTALEANLVPFFLVLGLLLFLKGLENKQFFLLSFLTFGFALYTYQSVKLFIPLLIIGLGWWAKDKIKLKWLFLPTLVFLIFLAPILFSPQPRLFDVSIFAKSQLAPLNEARFLCTKTLPDGLCRIFHNKLNFWSTNFLENYLSYFSPIFLFTPNRPSFSYANLPGTPLLYLFQLPLVLVGILALTKYKKVRFVLLLWLLLAPLPAALTVGVMHVNRAVTFVPIFSIFSAVGVDFIYRQIATRFQKTFMVVVVVIAAMSLMFVLESYLVHLPQNPPESLRFGYKQVIEFVETVKGRYDKVIFSKSHSEPQAFVAFYAKLDPRMYQQYAQDYLRYEKEGKLYLDQLERYQLGKYEFRDINWDKDKLMPNGLMVGGADEFPKNVAGLRTIYYPNGQIAFKIVESEVKK